MTEKQERIWRYIHDRFEAGSVKLMLIGTEKVKVTDKFGNSLTLETNQYGDVIDTGTGQVYAISDLPHDHTSTGKIPTSWKDVDRWAAGQEMKKPLRRPKQQELNK